MNYVIQSGMFQKNESQGNVVSNQFEQFFEEQGLIEKAEKQKLSSKFRYTN